MKTVIKMQLATGIYKIISGARKLVGAGDFVRVVRKGITWELDLSEGIDLAIFVFGRFESETAKSLETLVQPGAIVLDIGANIGAHTLPLARLVGPKGKVYAFEPTDYAFGKLKRNIELNPELAPRLVAKQIRLTNPEAADPGEIYSSWKVTGQEARHKKHLGIAKSISGARAMSLDEYWETAGEPKIEFIKIDVDGFEVDVIRGGQGMLKKCRAPICMELSPYVLEERGSSFAELFGVLRECGYQLVDLKRRLPIVDSNGRLGTKIPDGAGINALALARS
jgi:FkbM family methyltransferase